MKPRQSKTNARNAIKPESPVVGVSRRIPQFTRLVLLVRAGGRCEFPGCNQYLLKHPRTHSEANFSEVAHIVAFRKRGPRGTVGSRPSDINKTENLMLLCRMDHKEIDTHPARYPRETLERYKAQHEERIHHVTGLSDTQETTIVQLKGNINGKTVAIPAEHVTSAVAPRYPKDPKGCVIDLTGMNASDGALVPAVRETISHSLATLCAAPFDGSSARHVSVFALAPIPFLVCFGSLLSDKLAVDFFQFHRDTKDWTWKTSGRKAYYSLRRLRNGTDRSKVALMLSLSGRIAVGNLPSEIDHRFSVYEVSLRGRTPDPTFLRRRDDLVRFRTLYQKFLGRVMEEHDAVKEIHFFPACPAPIAIACGHDLLHKAHPGLRVYDYDKSQGGFSFRLRIN